MPGKKRSRRLLSLLLCGVAALPACRPAAEEAPAEPRREVWLFSEEEAEALRVPEEDWVILDLPRGPSAGPAILIEEPPVRDDPEGPIIEISSPADFSIRFEAAEPEGAVDIDTLTVVAHRLTFPKRRVDITEKLSGHKTERSVRAEGVRVPWGSYLIEISISDTAGVATNESYRLRVKR